MQLYNQLYLFTDFSQKHDYKFWGLDSGTLEDSGSILNIIWFPIFQKKLTVISPITACPNVVPLYTQATPALPYWPALLFIWPPMVTSSSYNFAYQPFLVFFTDTGPLTIRRIPPKCWNNSLSDTHHTWADHLIPGLIFFPGKYNT